MLEQIKAYVFTSIGLWTTIFGIVWFAGWLSNAINNSHFELDKLRDMYGFLMTQLNATHAINSIYNSPRGETYIK